MSTIVDYAGQEVAADRDVWTHGGAGTHLPPLDRLILDLIDRLGYSPAEVGEALQLPISRVAGTYWRSRWSSHRVANRVASVLRDSGDFDPRHAIVFELSAVCGYTFVEIGECLGFDRGHACRIASETAEKLRSHVRQNVDAPHSGECGYEAELLAALPAGDEQQTARECRLHYARNESLTPLERITLWREMLDAKDFESQAALGAAIGVPDSTIRNLLRLLTLPREWIDRVAHGVLPLCFLRPLLPIKERNDVLTALAERVQTWPRRPSYLTWCAIVAESLRDSDESRSRSDRATQRDRAKRRAA